MLKLTYNPLIAIIEGVLPEAVADQLYQTLAFKATGIDKARGIFYASRGKRNKMFAHWDGYTRLYNARYQSFATGLLTKACALLDAAGMPYELAPVTGWAPDVMTGASRIHVPTLRPDQAYVVDALLRGNRGTIQAPTGSGKSVCLAELCARFPLLKILVCVPTLGLLNQTRDAVARFTGEKVGIWGDGQFEDGRIVVATVQSAGLGLPDLRKTQGKCPQLTAMQQARATRLAQFQMVIYDEAHLVGSDSHRVLGYFVKNAWVRYGLSATLRREDNADLLLEGIIGPKVGEVTLDELIHATPPVLNDVVIEMVEYEHPRERKHLAWKETKSQVLQAVDRTDFALFQVYRLLALEGYANSLVTYRYEEHGAQMLARFREHFPEFRAELIDGDSSTALRDAAIARLASGETQVLFGSTITDVGIDCKPIQTLVPTNAECGRNLLMQRTGRVMRTHPTKTRPSKVVDVYDKGNAYLEAHAKLRLNHYTEVYGFTRVWRIDLEEHRRKVFDLNG